MFGYAAYQAYSTMGEAFFDTTVLITEALTQLMKVIDSSTSIIYDRFQLKIINRNLLSYSKAMYDIPMISCQCNNLFTVLLLSKPLGIGGYVKVMMNY